MGIDPLYMLCNHIDQKYLYFMSMMNPTKVFYGNGVKQCDTPQNSPRFHRIHTFKNEGIALYFSPTYSAS